jgi:hypothetical protein
LAAQLPRLPWTGPLRPHVTSLSSDVPLIGARLRWREAADSGARTPFARHLTIDAAASLRGGGLAQLHLQSRRPRAAWRVDVFARAAREVRFGFYGLGNDVRYDGALEGGSQPNYYGVRRQRALGRVEVTRWLSRTAAVAAALGLQRTSYDALEGPSVFRTEIGPAVRETDATARLTIVYDTRDHEAIPRRGVLLQASALAGTAAQGYRRLTALAQGFASPVEGTVLGLRVAGTSLSGDPPLTARFEMPTWERSLPLLGGDDSHRGIRGHRFVGSGALFAEIEARHRVAEGRDNSVWLVGFADAGRVFEGESFRIAGRGVHVSGGMGGALQGRGGVIGGAFAAWGADGPRVSVMSRWAF